MEFEFLQYLGGGNSYHYSKVKSKIDKGKNKILKTTAQARKIDKQGQKL